LIAFGGLALFALVVVLARRQLLTLRYVIAWSIIAGIGIVGALLIRVVEPLADRFGITPTGVLLAGASTVLLAIALQLSISVSSLQRAIRDLAEDNALMAQRLEEEIAEHASSASD
jgi:hypothetical protein